MSSGQWLVTWEILDRQAPGLFRASVAHWYSSIEARRASVTALSEVDVDASSVSTRATATDLSPEGPQWMVLFALLVFSAMLRVASFNGPLGSDDVVYLGRAVEISNGVWSSANYNGSLRYGFNIPAGFIIYLLGLSAFT